MAAFDYLYLLSAGLNVLPNRKRKKLSNNVAISTFLSNGVRTFALNRNFNFEMKSLI